MLDRCRLLPESKIKYWLKPGKPLRIEDGRLVVEFPPDIFCWTARRYSGLLGEAARGEGLEGIRIVAALDGGRAAA
jgi:hypothetical protein